MTNSIDEVEHYDCLFIIGSNTTEAHPIIGGKMKRAARRGAKLIIADPRHIELVDHAALWLRLIPGTDAALVNGMMNVIINEGWADQEFIAKRCENYDELWEVVKKYTPDVVAGITGVPEDQIRAAAELYAGTAKAGIFYTLGITEHTTGTANVMNLANLAMVTGHVGVPHTGVNPLRGQNNVQGACDMGALPNVYSGYRNVTKPENAAIFEEAWGVPMNRDLGLRTPEMFDAAHAGALKSMFVMGEDPILTDADANHVRGAIEALEFLVVQDIFMTETAKYAHVVLPAACYAEKDGTFTNTERRVPARAQGGRTPGRGAGGLGDRLRSGLSDGLPHELRVGGRHLRGDPGADAHVCRHDLRPGGRLRPAVALPHRGPSRNGLPARGHLPPGQGALRRGGVRGAGRADQPGLPDAAHHGPDALPVQHLHQAVPGSRRTGPGGAHRDQSGRRGRHRGGTRRADEGDVTARLGGDEGESHRPGAARASCS